ncbi:MAG: PD40 domain-containing protein [Bacteroidetes bacterium]|nr:PD40 domain-containing protein [Bacteroidota bacterium]
MHYKNILFLGIGIILAFHGNSQRNCEKADRYFGQNQFEMAIKYYQADIDSRNGKVSERALKGLADSYRIVGEFEKAEETYRRILKKKKKDPQNYLNYALSLKSSAKYAEAKLQFEEYIRMKPDDPMGEVYLKSCDSAQVWLDATIGKDVRNISALNTGFSEFSPVIVGNTLYFSSSRKGSTQALVSFDGGGELHRLDIYAVNLNSIDQNDHEVVPVVNVKELNSPMHDGSVCFSPDRREVYFTRTVKGDRDEKSNNILNTLQVFYSRLDSGGKWSKPESAFVFNSHKYSTAHPCLSADGKTIYFMSDMPGGFGKTDIYYSVRQSNGKWSSPRNAGREVNTFGYEMFPFISDKGILYFSSNAHPGMGQLDIFQASYENGQWSHVVNLKPPVNSIGNDFGICMDGTNNQGFFSSDRFNGKGAEDIYSFCNEEPLELSFRLDTLVFPDKGIFDELKYKLVNEKDKSEQELKSENRQYYIPIERGVPYRLVAKKNGMSVNKINFEYTIENHQLKLSLKSSSRAVRVDGKLFWLADSILSKTIVELADTLGRKKSSRLKTDGSFHLNDIIMPSQLYKLQSFVPDTDHMTILPANTIPVNGTIHYHDGAIVRAAVSICQNQKVIATLQTNEAGNFQGVVLYDPGLPCSIEIKAEGYKSKTLTAGASLTDLKIELERL